MVVAVALLSPWLSIPASAICYYCTPSRVRGVSLAVGSRARDFYRYSSEKMNVSAVDAAGEPSPLASDAGNGVREAENSDVLVQYIVLRRDLIDSWPLGSVVTQGCHASVSAIWTHKDDAETLSYCSPENIDSMHKVTLEVKGETQLLNFSEKLKNAGIAHKLWIEQPENFPTCLATKPYRKSIVSSFFKKLKLCK
ncbi:PREDICTED: putative peptidyl-tRNA hydrolase PTRHD1 [Nelumbo nucifera]|uniref:peptidyl-tRNA hydrolase n=2 Tax=Nelumbo nucifera TaxID=4432 RepID=A0A1U8A580_NELNU|nr:PREDICTED: putative peptidyl-tRNA hydrolase PTRHD1 [Nelumbo nucifera]DAD36790.1 TPA_asm: hypothetical protein HUJ06_007431 [Nelumbo nucifera]